MPPVENTMQTPIDQNLDATEFQRLPRARDLLVALLVSGAGLALQALARRIDPSRSVRHPAGTGTAIPGESPETPRD